MKTCEGCGGEPPLIMAGPFQGQHAMLDFCLHCSRDLCEPCMKRGCCGHKPASSGLEADEAPAGDEGRACPDHWHCHASAAAHECSKPDREKPCPTCRAVPRLRVRFPGNVAAPDPVSPERAAEVDAAIVRGLDSSGKPKRTKRAASRASKAAPPMKSWNVTVEWTPHAVRTTVTVAARSLAAAKKSAVECVEAQENVGDARAVDWRAAPSAARTLTQRTGDCACYYSCGEDSKSGDWHQHEDEPCPEHPDAPMVG